MARPRGEREAWEEEGGGLEAWSKKKYNQQDLTENAEHRELWRNISLNVGFLLLRII